MHAGSELISAHHMSDCECGLIGAVDAHACNARSRVDSSSCCRAWLYVQAEQNPTRPRPQILIVSTLPLTTSLPLTRRHVFRRAGTAPRALDGR